MCVCVHMCIISVYACVCIHVKVGSWDGRRQNWHWGSLHLWAGIRTGKQGPCRSCFGGVPCAMHAQQCLLDE